MMAKRFIYVYEQTQASTSRVMAHYNIILIIVHNYTTVTSALQSEDHLHLHPSRRPSAKVLGLSDKMPERTEQNAECSHFPTSEQQLVHSFSLKQDL